MTQELKDLKTENPLWIALDHEGGRVHRLPAPFTHFPSMSHVKTIDQAFQVGEAMGRELAAVEIDLDFAPVLDVWTNPCNKVIGDRAFSYRPVDVAELGTAFIRGLQGTGVAACGKHCPGHGDADFDSHFTLPQASHNRRRLEAIEWIPFRAAISEGLASIMTAHVQYDILDEGVPATLSPRIIRDTLRAELGFEGVIFSDDMMMDAIRHWGPIEKCCVMALQAGCDNILLCHQEERFLDILNSVYQSVESGEIAESVIENAYRRVQNLKQHFVLPKKDVPLSVIGSSDHRSLNRNLRIK